MLKLKNIEKEKFDEFVKNHKTKSHFLQSLSWGEFAKVKKHLTPYYLGLVNENDEIIAATLLLEKSLPMNMCYFYAPRGFVVDYKKKELVREMTKKVIEFAKNKKAIFVKIDPDIIKESTNYLGETKENPDYENKNENYYIFFNFKNTEIAEFIGLLYKINKEDLKILYYPLYYMNDFKTGNNLIKHSKSPFDYLIENVYNSKENEKYMNIYKFIDHNHNK